MELAILLALAASFCTATASVCQRVGARSSEVTGFDVWLVFRLARRPVWLLAVPRGDRRGAGRGNNPAGGGDVLGVAATGGCWTTSSQSPARRRSACGGP
jgi:hypothetical protein